MKKIEHHVHNGEHSEHETNTINQELKEIETKNSDKEIRIPPNTSPMKQSTKEERF